MAIEVITREDLNEFRTLLLSDLNTMFNSKPQQQKQWLKVNLEKNLGYAGNNNVGIEIALKQGADWVFVLNEDIILEASCLEKLIEVGECDPEIGILGPLVYHHSEPTVIQSAGGMLGKYWQSIHLGTPPRTGSAPRTPQHISRPAWKRRRGPVDRPFQTGSAPR